MADDGGHDVRVVVADHGPGVAPGDRERVFEPLTRLDRGGGGGVVGRAGEGFGLGLAAARATLRAFGGDLVCRARRDGRRGAEFVFTFAKPAAPPPNASLPHDTAAGGRTPEH